MIIRVACMAWGDPYLGYWLDLVLPSLSDDIGRLRIEGHRVEVLEPYISFMNFVHAEVEAAAISETFTFFTAADIIWAKGSLYNLACQSRDLQCAIAVPHFRVNDDDFIKLVSSGSVALPVSPPALASQALLHAHNTFTRSFDDLPENQCHWGISVREIDNGLHIMRHNLPHVAMLKFIQDDARFFDYMYQQGVAIDKQWDRLFLEKLAHEGRLKIAGSSDIAFGVELTSPLIVNPERANNYDDRLLTDNAANKLCRSTLYTIRSQG